MLPALREPRRESKSRRDRRRDAHSLGAVGSEVKRDRSRKLQIIQLLVAEGVGFEPTRERNPLPVFKTGALNHSATLPDLENQRTWKINALANQ
jgi:hypothetical protein